MSTDELLESSATSMTDEEIRDLLREEGVGVLALPDEEVPYLLPMSFGFDGESALYFLFLLFGAESRKERLGDRTDRARFLVYRARSMHDWQSVSIVGRLETVAEDDWEQLRSAMENAWHPDLFSSASPMRGVQGYEFQVDEWTGIKYGD